MLEALDNMYFSGIALSSEFSLYKTYQFSTSCLYEGACQVSSLGKKALKAATDSIYGPIVQKPKDNLTATDPKNLEKKKKSSKVVHYLVLGTAVAVTALLILNLWNQGTLQHFSGKVSLDDEVPVLDRDLIKMTPTFTPKSFIPLVVLAESVFFFKKHTVGVSSSDIIKLAKNSPIIAAKYISEFSSDVQDSIRKAVASALVCMKNSGLTEDETQYRMALSSARMIYPKYDENELASEIANCQGDLAWEQSTASAYLQALEDVQKVEKFLNQDDPVFARKTAGQIKKRPLAFLLHDIGNIQEKTDQKVDFWYAKNMHRVLSAYENPDQGYNPLKYGEFCREKATELLRVVAETSHLQSRTELQDIQRILRLIRRFLTPSLDQVKVWNALMISSPYCVKDYRELLPVLLQIVTLDKEAIRAFLESWKGNFTLLQQRDFSLIVLDSCLKNPKSSDRYHFFLSSVQQMITHYPLMQSCGFLDRAAQAFVSSYEKRRGEFVFDANTIAILRKHQNPQAVEPWLTALSKAFQQKGFSSMFDLLERDLKQKQQGTYTYTCDNGDRLQCTGAKVDCDREWRASCPKPKSNSGERFFGFEDFFGGFNFGGFNFGGGFRNSGSGNTRPNTDTQKPSEFSNLKSVSADLQAYKSQKDNKDLKNKAGASLFEYYTKMGKSALDVQGKDVGEQLWPQVTGILDKDTLRKLWLHWTMKNHPDKIRNVDQVTKDKVDSVFKTGSAIHDCLLNKLDDRYAQCS